MKTMSPISRADPGSLTWSRPDAPAVSGLRAWASRHSLVLYFLLAFAISWALEIPLALLKQGFLQARVPSAIHYLASFGPMTAALIVTGLTQGRHGIRMLLARLLKWRVGLRW